MPHTRRYESESLSESTDQEFTERPPEEPWYRHPGDEKVDTSFEPRPERTVTETGETEQPRQVMRSIRPRSALRQGVGEYLLVNRRRR